MDLLEPRTSNPAAERWRSRRRFLRKVVGFTAGGTFGLAGGGLAWAEFGERHYPRVRRVTVTLPELPAELHGYRICQISDLHRGRFVKEAYLRRAAAMVNAQHADLIAITGDFIDRDAANSESCAAALTGLQARDGVYGVLGNHDHWTNKPDEVAHCLEKAGVRVLFNRSVRLTTRGTAWSLCGIDDIWAGDPNVKQMLRDVPERGFRLLLSHAPDFADTAAEHGFRLTLSGHSHGGQILIPGRPPLVTPPHGQKYPLGLQRVGDSGSYVYTNVGLGVVFPPIRVNCPPEVTVLTLEKARA